MKDERKPLPSLMEVEKEVVAESREWGRRRLEARLQELADQQGELSPPRAAQASHADPAQRARPVKTTG
jgi:hypothetical protein